MTSSCIVVETFYSKADYSEVAMLSSIEKAIEQLYGEYEGIGFVLRVWRDRETGLVYSESAEEDFDAAWVKHETELLEERYDLTMANNHSEWFNLCHRDMYINDWREGVPVRRGPKAADLAKSKISRGFSVEAEMEGRNAHPHIPIHEWRAGMSGIRCIECGKFISYEDKKASVYFEPDHQFGRERVEWTCGACVERGKLTREDRLPVKEASNV